MDFNQGLVTFTPRALSDYCDESRLTYALSYSPVVAEAGLEPAASRADPRALSLSYSAVVSVGFEPTSS